MESIVRKKRNYVVTPKRLEVLRRMAELNRGKKRTFSTRHINAMKATRGKTPVRNWKGGISYDRVAYNREWRKKLSDEKRRRLNLLLKNSQRLRQGIEGSHTLEEWEQLKQQYDFMCPACGRKEPEVTLTEDHIVPVSKGGTNNIDNIQPLCRSCNSRKNNKTIKY